MTHGQINIGRIFQEIENNELIQMDITFFSSYYYIKKNRQFPGYYFQSEWIKVIELNAKGKSY